MRSIESLRSQSLQLHETLKAQDPEKRLLEVRRASDHLAERLEQFTAKDGTGKLTELLTQQGQTFAQLHDRQQVAVQKFQSTLSRLSALFRSI